MALAAATPSPPPATEAKGAALRSPVGWRGHARAIPRLAAFALGTALLWSARLATRPLRVLSPRAADRCHAFFMRSWAAWTAWLLRMRIECHGRPPQAPFFLVSNHLSYIDVVPFFRHVDGFFLARGDAAHWPLLGPLAASVGTLFIDRERRMDLKRVAAEGAARLAAGKGMIVFPEATSSDGRTVLPFHSALFELPIRAGLPVHTASIAYETPSGAPPAAHAVCWWGDMAFLPHLYRLFALPAVHATLRFSTQGLHGTERKRLAAGAEEGVRVLHRTHFEQHS